MFSPLVCRGFDAPANVSLPYSIRSGVRSGSWSGVNGVLQQPAHHLVKASPFLQNKQGVLPLPSPFPSRYP